MFKDIISRRLRYIIPFIPSKYRRSGVCGYKIGTHQPDFVGLPADFVGINPDQPLADKVKYNHEGIPTGLRIMSGDGIWFKAFTEKYAPLENRHFDSFESFYYFHDQI